MSQINVSAGLPGGSRRFAIAIHGGVGGDPAKFSPDERESHLEGLQAAIDTGRRMLADGASALDTVEQVVRVLEDHPAFNAGHGAVFNAEGTHELDAAIMDGRTHAGGAVAGVHSVKNPVSLARLVMTETPHVLLIGTGAEAFADKLAGHRQIERVPNEYFSTPARRAEWHRHRERLRTGQAPEVYRGTVGCVALDLEGNLAAATSTGGMTNKQWGRVGDTPILGAGTYADNATCAVSCTGTGEYFIRECIAYRLSALMAYKGWTLEAAARYLLDEHLPVDTGGLIAVSHTGEISMHKSTAGMSRACADSTGRLEIAL